MPAGWRRRVFRPVSVFALLVLSVTARAESIEGFYRVEGSGPGPGQPYEGEAQIKKTGETYTIMWRIGERSHIGTGILTSDVLSILFVLLGARGAAGVASFRVIGDKVAGGTWTVLGGKLVGQERWVLDRGL